MRGAGLDVRVAADLGEAGMEALLEEWTSCRGGLSYSFIQKCPVTSASEEDSPYWKRVVSALQKEYDAPTCAMRHLIARPA